MGAGTSFSITIEGRVLTQKAYSLEVCAETDLLRRTPTLSDEELAYYYAHNDWSMHCFPRLFPTERLLRKELLAHLPPDARVLDIGCGDGRLLNSLPSSVRKYGTELSAGAAQSAQAKNISILSHDTVVAGDHGLFDAIVLVDVFEHLREPHAFLSPLTACLKPGGLIGISTGDGDYCLETSRPADSWYWRIPVHLCMMTERYARYVEQHLGLERVSRRQSSHYPFDTKSWVKQFLQKLLFEFWHDRKHPWMAPWTRLFSPARRAQNWQTTPKYSYGRDHVVLIWRKALDAGQAH
jgi:SAM-dependent methyltransferase